MPVICCVVGCTNRFIKGGSIQFFRIPAEPDRKQKWIAAISRENWKPSSWSGICNSHFLSGKASNDNLDPDYVPSLKMGPEKKTHVVLSLERYPRISKASESIKPEEPSSKSIKRACLLDVSEENTKQLQPTPKRRQDKDLRSEIKSLTKKIKSLEELNEKTKFGENFVRGDDMRTRCLTGIPTYTAFCWVLSTCYCILPKSRNLSPGDTLIMILSKVKLNLSTQTLAYRYNTTQARVVQILHLSIPLLAKKLQFIGREDNMSALPEDFKQGIYRVLLLLTLKKHL